MNEKYSLLPYLPASSRKRGKVVVVEVTPCATLRFPEGRGGACFLAAVQAGYGCLCGVRDAFAVPNIQGPALA